MNLSASLVLGVQKSNSMDISHELTALTQALKVKHRTAIHCSVRLQLGEEYFHFAVLGDVCWIGSVWDYITEYGQLVLLTN